jgi:hypothetical protein
MQYMKALWFSTTGDVWDVGKLQSTLHGKAQEKELPWEVIIENLP